MNKELYEMIFKRKSYHTFKNYKTQRYYKDDYSITSKEYKEIEEAFNSFDVLYPDIKVAMRITDNEETTCSRGQEKVILLYSEEKDNYLMNIGYIAEQLDLYLASKNIGALWYGLNKAVMPDYKGMKYVIMIAISKTPETSFRKDMYKSKRKDKEEIWKGEDIFDIGNIVRFAPSACNTQPWIAENVDSTLYIYRYQSPNKKWVMPREGVFHMNHIDIGIFLCFLDLCLSHYEINFDKELYVDDKSEEMNLVAKYKLNNI